MADIGIYLLGLSEISGINLEEEIQKKVYKNSKREYKVIDGVLTRVKEYDGKENWSPLLRYILRKKVEIKISTFLY